MRFALIGDIHVYASAVPRRRLLLSRRIVGHTNLILTRRRRFNHALMDPIFDRVTAIDPELVLYSGDVSTTSLEHEFDDVLRYIRPLAEKVPSILVPGNHDRYTFGARRVRRIETMFAGVIPDAFPHVRQMTDRWRLLALDSAVPRVVSSSGALGPEQLEAALEAIADTEAGDGLVVLCHYPAALPPLTPHARSHDLVEQVPLREALAACKGRVLYLHGHIHKPWHIRPDGDRPPFECINAGSPCLMSDKYPLGQGFWEVRLPDDPRDQLRAVHHVPMPATKGRPPSVHDIRWDVHRTATSEP